MLLHALQVFGWDAKGTIVFNEVLCEANWVKLNGGCYYGMGSAFFNNGTKLRGNEANNGAGICERNMCKLVAPGLGVISTTGMFFSGQFGR